MPMGGENECSHCRIDAHERPKNIPQCLGEERGIARSAWTRIIAKISKWVFQKAAYRAGVRDEVRNKPLRQYRDPSLQIAYMFGRVEVREYR